jgi:hypothetical protein
MRCEFYGNVRALFVRWKPRRRPPVTPLLKYGWAPVSLRITWQIPGRSIHLREGVALLIICYVPFSFNDAINRHFWKFQIHNRNTSQSVQTDQGPPPKYRVFNWGHRNTQLKGGGVIIIEAIVFDESDGGRPNGSNADQTDRQPIRTRKIPEAIRIDAVLFCSQYLWKDVVKMEGKMADLTHKFTGVNAAARREVMKKFAHVSAGYPIIEISTAPEG